MKYHEQIKHPLWQKKRLEVLRLHNFECENCGTSEIELHVHHPYYKRGAMIWDYDLEELECLCTVCHKEAHALDERIKKALAKLSSPSFKHQALGYLEALDGDTPLYPDSYEYCLGVSDFISYGELSQKDQNRRHDEIMNYICENKGKDGLFFMEIYHVK